MTTKLKDFTLYQIIYLQELQKSAQKNHTANLVGEKYARKNLISEQQSSFQT